MKGRQSVLAFLGVCSAALVLAGHTAAGSEAPQAFIPERPQEMLGGDKLASYCTGRFDVDAGFCAGYITAISDIMMDYAIYGNQACLMGGIKAQQLMDMAQQDILNVRTARNRPAAVMISEIIAVSFPCYGNIDIEPSEDPDAVGNMFEPQPRPLLYPE